MATMSGRQVIAFINREFVGRGALADVAAAAWKSAAGDPNTPILIFDARTSHPVEVDLRGDLQDVLARIPPEAEPATTAPDDASTTTRGPGRPKLGVVAREVTLLPRHWQWLNDQPGGASVAIRKLVEDARRASAESDQRRGAQESAYRFMSAMAGDQPGFEEASRALFAGDPSRFDAWVESWPAAIRDHLRALAQESFGEALRTE